MVTQITNLADSGYYIWINGFPGVGKLTVATELQRRLPGSVLLDNHTLIDIVTLPRDHVNYDSERRRARQAAFAEHVYSQDEQENAERLQRVIIATGVFTLYLFQLRSDCLYKLTRVDALSDCAFDKAVAAEHKDAAIRGKRPFFPVYLYCSKEENLKRVVNPQRVRDGKKKLLDAGIVEAYIDTLHFFKWAGEGVEVDNTDLTAGEAAEWIMAGLEEHSGQLYN